MRFRRPHSAARPRRLAPVLTLLVAALAAWPAAGASAQDPADDGTGGAAAPPPGAVPAPAPGDATPIQPGARRVMASWYGPGLFGNRTACGRRLTRRTVGVAHRTLPCGTIVTVSYRSRSVVVPVIDRGPFVRGVELDLTQAAARRLGVRATVPVAALSQAPPAR